MSNVQVLMPSPCPNILPAGGIGLSPEVVSGNSFSPCQEAALRDLPQRHDSESDTPPSKKPKKVRRAKRRRPAEALTAFEKLRKPEAPSNTNEFLMQEHDTGILQLRQRDSSMSMESEDYEADYSSRSVEEEEEYLTREFWTTYEDIHWERLDRMSKTQLVQEFMALEEKVDFLERELEAVRARHHSHDSSDSDEEERPFGELRVDNETAAKISIFQEEIQRLQTENKSLREENLRLKFQIKSQSSSSSSSSSSTSSSSASSSSSDSDSDHTPRRKEAAAPIEDHLVSSGTAAAGLLKDICDSSVQVIAKILQEGSRQSRRGKYSVCPDAGTAADSGVGDALVCSSSDAPSSTEGFLPTEGDVVDEGCCALLRTEEVTSTSRV